MGSRQSCRDSFAVSSCDATSHGDLFPATSHATVDVVQRPFSAVLAPTGYNLLWPSESPHGNTAMMTEYPQRAQLRREQAGEQSPY